MTDSVNWQHFEPAVLARAADEDRPVLMLITAPWCQHCRELLATSFADPGVVEIVHESFLPVHVDAERRPDVNQRYGTGAWPTIAWLTPDGELIAHDNFLDTAELHVRLTRIRDAWRTDKDNIQRRIGELWAQADERTSAGGERLRREMVDDITSAIYTHFDREHGGFGDGIKFPHPEALDFALVQVQKRGDAQMREVVRLTLDKMMESPLHDHVAGGFFRYSKTPDWHAPNYEKLLDQNALVLRTYLEAFQVFGDESYRRTAEGIVGWILDVMRDEHSGSFAGSQDGDADYFVGDHQERSRREPPAIDRTVYCHANGIAVSGLLKAAAVLDRPRWRDAAMAALRFLLDNLYDGKDVYHYWDGTYHLPGMLADQAHLIRALIDAAQNTGDSDLLLPAERIAERCLEQNRAPNGGFFDILHDPRQQGSMRRRNRSILDNAAMAESLMRLSYLSRRPELYDEATTALEAFANDYPQYGYYVASYGRSVDLCFYPPLIITIVGERDAAATAELRRTALSPYVPSRIVQTLDPTRDPILLSRSGLTPDSSAVAHLTVGSTPQGTAHNPEELLEAIDSVERDRRQGLSDD
ncbi:MAG TPA: thioredoxin domain-containing protein [bacterium]|nr:thioredoxin domain-containing protein [bacterium]